MGKKKNQRNFISLIKEGEKLIAYRRYEEAEKIFNESLKIPGLSNFQKLVIYLDLGVVFLNRGIRSENSKEIQKGKEYFKKCLYILEKKGVKRILLNPRLKNWKELASRLFFNIGESFFFFEKYKEAKENFSKSFRFKQENLKAKLREAECLFKLEEFQKGERILNDLLKKPLEFSLKIEALLSLGEIKFHQNDLKRAEEIFDKLQEIIEKSEELKEFLPKVLIYKSGIYHFKGKDDLALKFASLAIKEKLKKLNLKEKDLERINQKSLPHKFIKVISVYLLIKGEILNTLGKTKEALECFHFIQKFGLLEKEEIEKYILKIKKKEIKSLPPGNLLGLPPCDYLALPSRSIAGVIFEQKKEKEFQKVSQILEKAFSSKSLFVEAIEKIIKKMELLNDNEIDDFKDGLIFQILRMSDVKGEKKNIKNIFSLSSEEIWRYFKEIQKRISF